MIVRRVGFPGGGGGEAICFLLFHLDKIAKNIKTMLRCRAVKVHCDWRVQEIFAF